MSSEDDFHNAELLVGELLYHRTFDLRDLGVIACLLKKQSFRIDRLMETNNGISDNAICRPWETTDSSTETKRSR
ncbi:hypothetical protein [Sphingobacterium daejeonense]|uniref:hypothetical protein n=1 Tax=Sphingobacterium daejeonense TaxID=371142 RepID=UPI0010FD93FC|nr:hypothetical protein [Sphingobacterium daejeonense]